MMDNHRRKVRRLKNLFMIYGTILGSLISTSEYSDDKIVDNNPEYNYAMEYYYNHSFDNYCDYSVQFYNVPVDDSLIYMLPSHINSLDLDSIYFINDLEKLPKKCPNLEYLRIDTCPNIINYDFIYSLPKLKELYIYNPSNGINQELIDYLNNKGIKHNLTTEMIEEIQRVDEIYYFIISDDMDENEKVNAISSYIINNVKWDLDALKDDNQITEYNLHPIKYALDGKGVCVNYSHLFQRLCSRCNITNYLINNYVHIWNLVKIDDKYYYIDLANINQIPPLTNKLLAKDMGFYYKQDPYDTSLSFMKDIDDVLVPEKLLKQINEAQKNKSLIEKYGSNFCLDVVILASLLCVPVPFIPVRSKRESQMRRLKK